MRCAGVVQLRYVMGVMENRNKRLRRKMEGCDGGAGGGEQDRGA
jgi:hypothetical protein